MQVANVIIFSNGMVAAFDLLGKQVPEYQGPINFILPKLIAAGYTGRFETQCGNCGVGSRDSVLSPPELDIEESLPYLDEVLVALEAEGYTVGTLSDPFDRTFFRVGIGTPSNEPQGSVMFALGEDTDERRATAKAAIRLLGNLKAWAESRKP